jgi:thiamine biosynthesis lipoprotein ApbE
VTVVVEDCALADGLATALNVAPKRRAELLRHYPDARVY